MARPLPPHRLFGLWLRGGAARPAQQGQHGGPAALLQVPRSGAERGAAARAAQAGGDGSEPSRAQQLGWRADDVGLVHDDGVDQVKRRCME